MYFGARSGGRVRRGGTLRRRECLRCNSDGDGHRSGLGLHRFRAVLGHERREQLVLAAGELRQRDVDLRQLFGVVLCVEASQPRARIRRPRRGDGRCRRRSRRRCCRNRRCGRNRRLRRSGQCSGRDGLLRSLRRRRHHCALARFRRRERPARDSQRRVRRRQHRVRKRRQLRVREQERGARQVSQERRRVDARRRRRRDDRGLEGRHRRRGGSSDRGSLRSSCRRRLQGSGSGDDGRSVHVLRSRRRGRQCQRPATGHRRPPGRIQLFAGLVRHQRRL